MKHTECKDCALGNGDCGHHFEMDGVTNYDIASLSACDKYGNCMFFKAKAKPQDKRISSEALKEVINDLFRSGEYDCNSVLKAIDNAPTVTPSLNLNNITEEDIEKFMVKFQRAHSKGLLTIAERPQGEWIPVRERLPEERINPNTNDFEDVLCSTIWDDVRLYKYGKPTGYHKAHFWHGGGIMDEAVIAWQYKPEPYKKGGAK